MTKDQGERAPERRDLEKRLEHELRTIFTEIEAQRRNTVLAAPNLADQAITSIEQQRPNQAAPVRQYMQYLISHLDALKPTFADGVPPDESLLEALERTTDLVLEFVRVAEAVATMNTTEPAHALYDGFGDLLEKYNLGNRGVGINNVFVGQFDFYKFVGHELFVTFFSLLIRERRWTIVADLLEDDFHLDNSPSSIAGSVSFEYVSEKVVLLEHRKERLQLPRASIHADIIHDRHTKGDLGTLIPIDRFTEADYFLFLRSILRQSEENKIIGWDAWSCVYMERRTPRYLVEASQRKYAQQLLKPFGVPDIETLRSRLSERAGRVAYIFGPGSRVNPVAYLDIKGIGSR